MAYTRWNDTQWRLRSLTCTIARDLPTLAFIYFSQNCFVTDKVIVAATCFDIISRSKISRLFGSHLPARLALLLTDCSFLLL